ncbi:MAG: flagellar basal-body MS-ring/collar protein FliF [Armatimonadota bacterium]
MSVSDGSALLRSIQAFWNSLTGTQRFLTALFVGGSLVLLAAVSVFATRPRMAVLFSGLAPEDAGAIVAKLQEKGVAYKLDGDGTIKVPAKNVYDLRLQMATAGLPQGGTVGFEIFDKNNFSMTEFTQQLNYQRALQGELSRTIAQIDKVEAARVHIVLPKPSVFETETAHPSASVVLKLRPGGELQPEQVGGIVHLVASAVEKMKPEYVTVVDTRGTVLSEASEDGFSAGARLSTSQLELKRRYETAIEREVQTMLDRVVGPNKAVVRANVRLNLDQRETHSEIVQPLAANKGALSSEERTEETYGGTQPPAQASTGGGRLAQIRVQEVPEKSYHRLETVNKYDLSKTTEHVVKAPGTVEQLSVAVMLDGDLSSYSVPAIKSAVEAVAGIDANRGDRVIVEAVPFDKTAARAEEKEFKAAATRETFISVGKGVGAAAILMIFLFFLRGIVKQINFAPPTSPQPEAAGSPAPETVSTAQVEIPQPPVEAVALAGSDSTGVNPEAVARVVREWISRD